MATVLLERPRTIRIRPARTPSSTGVEPNFGPDDMHAIRAIFGIMVAILTVALVMYGAIALLAI
jgi:hypothetical protein